MKKFSETKTNRKPPNPRAWQRMTPTPLPTDLNPYENISRILPIYAANNFKYFELLTVPKYPPKDIEDYIRRLKEKIACMKRELLL